MTSVSAGRVDSAAWTVARNLAILERSQRAAEQGSTLGTADARLLWLFGDGTPRTLRDVADTLGLEQSTVNRQVNGALGEGLLRRYRTPGRAAALLEATDEGRTRLAENLDWRFGLFDRALAAVPPGERTRFLELLTTFVDAYDQATQSVEPPPPTTRRG